MSRKLIIKISILCFFLGVLLGEVYLLHFDTSEFHWGLLYLALTPILLIALPWSRLKITTALFFVTLLAIGLTRSLISHHHPKAFDVDYYASDPKLDGESQEVVIRGLIIADVVDRSDYQQVVVEASQIYFPTNEFPKSLPVFHSDGFSGVAKKEVEGKVLANISRFSEANYGQEVLLQGKLEIPGEFENFSYRNYLAKDQIYSYLPRAEVLVIASDQGNFIKSFLFTLKQDFAAKLTAILPSPASGFASGILLGTRAALGEQVLADFTKTGLLHLLALSGFNITIIILAVFWLFKPLPKTIRVGLTLLIICLFVLMVGAGASILRAGIMGGLGIVVMHSGRRADPFYLLLLASMIMVLLNPKILLFDVSFQLSVAGVIGLITFVPIIENWRFIREIPNFLALKEALVITISAQIIVTPLTLFYFNTFSPISFIANPLLAPLIPLAMLLSFLAALFAYIFWPLAEAFGFFAYLVLSLGLKIASSLAKVPWAQVSAQIGLVLVIFWYLLVLLALYYHSWRQKKLAPNSNSIN
jgi:competence protein ComEC